MKLLVGLGNPGATYERSPHNAGFEVMDALAAKANLSFRENRRFRSALAKGTLAGNDVVFMKPLTFMNASGEAVGHWMRWHRLDASDLVVVYDDADLELGRLRIRKQGSSGGHNGLTSVIQHVASDQFVRIRIGIGRGTGDRDMISHVLRPLSGQDGILLQGGVERAVEAVQEILRRGVDQAMNRFNAAPQMDDKAESKKQE